MMNIKIAPSILSADFGRLADEIRKVEEAGAHMIHIDVMDGHFVPNLTYGPMIVRKCKDLTKLPLDVHLMITNAEQSFEQYIDAGTDYLSVHQEAVTHLQRTLEQIRSKGVKAGVALNPATPVETVRWLMPELSFILIMTVNPGFEAQSFIPQCLEKVMAANQLFKEYASTAEIEVDGGVGPENASQLIQAGASILVAGSAIYKSASPAETIKTMMGEATQ